MKDAASDPATQVRQLLRRADRASLSTLLARDGSGAPYASLALLTVAQDGSPLLLLSDLADHSANLKADPRLSLLVEATAGYADPLEGPRASLLGRAERCDDPRALARFVARHPGAELYAGFADFHLYRVMLSAAHLVAGFGRIHWLEAAEVTYPQGPSERLAEAEAGVLEHMNDDHADAVAQIAEHLGGGAPGAWRMVGIDPEGADFRLASELVRVDFETAINGSEDCRAALVELTRRARQLARDSAA